MRGTSIRFCLVVLLLVGSATLPFSVIKAGNEADTTLITLQKKSRGLGTQRPKAPDRQQVTCAYDGEVIYLNFAIPEGMATLSVTDGTGLTAIYNFDSSTLEVCISVGQLYGTVSIEVITGNDNTYNGTM